MIKGLFVLATLVVFNVPNISYAGYICQCYRTWSNYPTYDFMGLVEGDSLYSAQNRCEVLVRRVNGVPVIFNCQAQ